jgi:hypothetical protein
MDAAGRIRGEVDRLFGVVELSFCLDGTLSEPFDLFVLLSKFLILVFYLRPKFLDFLAQFFGFRTLRLTTPQQKRGDHMQRRLEIPGLFVP